MPPLHHRRASLRMEQAATIEFLLLDSEMAKSSTPIDPRKWSLWRPQNLVETGRGRGGDAERDTRRGIRGSTRGRRAPAREREREAARARGGTATFLARGARRGMAKKERRPRVTSRGSRGGAASLSLGRRRSTRSVRSSRSLAPSRPDVGSRFDSIRSLALRAALSKTRRGRGTKRERERERVGSPDSLWRNPAVVLSRARARPEVSAETAIARSRGGKGLTRARACARAPREFCFAAWW